MSVPALAPVRCLQCPFVTRSVECVHRCPKNSTSLPSSIRRIIQPRGWRVLAFSAGGDGGSETLECDDLERWCGGWALPWHRADLGFFGAHALSRCARVARMDSCGPLLATHFLLEKQIEGASSIVCRQTNEGM